MEEFKKMLAANREDTQTPNEKKQAQMEVFFKRQRDARRHEVAAAWAGTTKLALMLRRWMRRVQQRRAKALDHYKFLMGGPPAEFKSMPTAWLEATAEEYAGTVGDTLGDGIPGNRNACLPSHQHTYALYTGKLASLRPVYNQLAPAVGKVTPRPVYL
jgi:hypothetical protein